MATKMTCEKVRELASGFVLGALDTDELIAVQDHLDTCANGHAEIDELGGVVPYLAVTIDPVEPPAWLRESVIAAARADLQASRRVGKVTERRASEPVRLVAAAEPVAPRRGNVISLAAQRIARRRKALAYGLSSAAAVLALVVTGIAFVIPGQAADPSQRILGFTQEQGARVLTFQGQVNGTIVLRPTGHLWVQLNGLSATRGDETYVIWITADNGVVTKLTSFRVDGSGSAFLDGGSVPNSASLWVNISKEPNDKATKPTGPSVVTGAIPL
jgi:hypothetical protein